MRRLRLLCAAAVLGLAAACAQMPEEAVTLSATIGQDLEEVERAHVALADGLFDRLEDQVNNFIDKEYTPTFIQRFVRKFDLPAEITRANNAAPEFVPVLLTDFVSDIHEVTEAKRKQLLGPIRQQRAQVLADIRESYGRMKTANAAVTAHLNSIAELHEAQNEVLSQAGLPGDLRQRIGNRVAGLSNTVERLTQKGRNINAALEDTEESIASTIDSLDGAIDEISDELEHF